MPNCSITRRHVLYAACTITLIALLVGGSKVLSNSGSSGVKEAVKEYGKCQELELEGGKPYQDCQKELNDLLIKLVAENELDVKNQCKVNPDGSKSALCTVTVWYVTKNIVTNEPGIVQKVNESVKGTQSSTQSITRGMRRKRGANSPPTGRDLYLQETLVRRKRTLFKKVVDKVKEKLSDSGEKSSRHSDEHDRKRTDHQDVDKPSKKTGNTATKDKTDKNISGSSSSSDSDDYDHKRADRQHKPRKEKTKNTSTKDKINKNSSDSSSSSDSDDNDHRRKDSHGVHRRITYVKRGRN